MRNAILEGIGIDVVSAYIVGLLIYAVTMSVAALRDDMRGKWSTLLWWERTATPFVIAYLAIRWSFPWPYYFWVEEKRKRDQNRHVRRLIREMGR
jgi:hypothetical protein